MMYGRSAASYMQWAVDSGVDTVVIGCWGGFPLPTATIASHIAVAHTYGLKAGPWLTPGLWGQWGSFRSLYGANYDIAGKYGAPASFHWTDFHNAGFQDDLADMCVDWVQNQGADLVHLDYIRYPYPDSNWDCRSKGLDSDITNTVLGCYNAIKAYDPTKLLTCAVFTHNSDQANILQFWANTWLPAGYPDECWLMFYEQDWTSRTASLEWYRDSLAAYHSRMVQGISIDTPASGSEFTDKTPAQLLNEITGVSAYYSSFPSWAVFDSRDLDSAHAADPATTRTALYYYLHQLTPPPPPPYIGLIDHETGDTSQYASVTGHAGDITVTPAAALAGTDYGLAARVNDTTAAYGQWNFPSAPVSHADVRLRFYFDPNSISMTSGEIMGICLLTCSQSPYYIAAVMLKKSATPGLYIIRIRGWTDAGTYDSTDACYLTDEPHWIELLVHGEATNGYVQVWVDDLDTALPTITRDNDTITAHYSGVRFGVQLSNTSASASGTVYIDQIQIDATADPIGPVAPTADLSVDKTLITIGEAITLSWTTTNANAASIDQGIGAVALTGSMAVYPTTSTVYTLTATGDGGTATDLVSVVVDVNPLPPSPPSLNANTVYVVVTHLSQPYELWLLHPADGHPLCTFESSSFQYAKVVQGVGSFKTDLLPSFDWSLAQEDARVVIWRTPPGGVRAIDFVGFVRMPEKSASGGLVSRFLSGPCLNELLRVRVHNKTDDDGTTWRGVTMDDIMKDIVRKNLGALATGTGRDLSAYGFTVQANASAGRASGARRTGGYHAMMRPVLDICQELSALSAPWEAGQTPQQFFGIVPLGVGWECEFRTASQQWGRDLRNSVFFGLEWGNVEQVNRTVDYREEMTVAYTLGDWTDGSRIVNEYIDTGRVSKTPFNRREMVVEASGMDEDTLHGLGASAVQANRPRHSFSAKLSNVGSRIYGRDYGLGDYVTAVFDGESYQCRIETVTVTVNGDAESVDITLREDTP